jgi:hypothetical protein
MSKESEWFPMFTMIPCIIWKSQLHCILKEHQRGEHIVGHPNKWRTVQWQVTQHMQIPLSYADAVIGTAGANISYMRHTSGATITIQETRGVPGEMTVEIHGSASQVQTAQQLVQVWFSPSLFISISSWPVCLSIHVFSVWMISHSDIRIEFMSWELLWSNFWCLLR